MGWLEDMYAQVNQNQEALDNLGTNPAPSEAPGFSINNLASGFIGGLSNGIGMVKTGQQLTQLPNNSEFQNQLATGQTLANMNYGTIGQWLSAPQFNIQHQTADDVRGMTKAQRNGLVGSTALSGASAGASVGSIFGPIGTAIGAGVGAIGGLVFGGIKDREGQRNAQIEADYNNLQADNIQFAYNTNRNAAIERIQSRDNAEKVVRAVANGGQIERKQMDIRDFANKVLNRRDSPMRVERQKCNGGVMIRIKK